MPIKVACSCGQSFAAPDNLAGRTVKCPKCGQPLKIPAAGPQQPAAPIAPAAGGGLADLLAEEGLATGSGAGGGVKCPSCGASMMPGAHVCVQCGFNVQTRKKMTVNTGAISASQGAEDMVAKASREAAAAPREESEGEKMVWAFVMAIFAVPLLIVCVLAVFIWGSPIAAYADRIFASIFSGDSSASKYLVPSCITLVGSILIFVGWFRLQLFALEQNRINGVICLIYSAGVGILTVFLLSLITAAMIVTSGEETKLVENLEMDSVLVWQIVGFLIAKIGLGAYAIVTGIIYWRACLIMLIILISGMCLSLLGDIILWFFVL